jgi:inner membrane protein
LEPITHFLTGACLARAGCNRKTALATATMTLAAEAPDLDTLWGLKGPVYTFAHHRGFTHSFLGLVLVAGLVTGFMYLVWRMRGRRTNLPNLPPRWGWLFCFAYIAGVSHILLDFTNNYGVRPFWPFSEKWYSWDIVFILEPALYLILVSALLLPAFVSRNRPLPRGALAARLALLGVLGFYALRDHEHRGAVHVFETSLLQSTGTPMRASAYPYLWNIFRWHAVGETRDSFVSVDVDTRTGELDSMELEILSKPEETPVTLAAKRSYLGRVYLDWAKYPLVTEVHSGEDAVVAFEDLRFYYPSLRGRLTLSCSIELNQYLQVVREKFGLREQAPPFD